MRLRTRLLGAVAIAVALTITSVSKGDPIYFPSGYPDVTVSGGGIRYLAGTLEAMSTPVVETLPNSSTVLADSTKTNSFSLSVGMTSAGALTHPSSDDVDVFFNGTEVFHSTDVLDFRYSTNGAFAFVFAGAPGQSNIVVNIGGSQSISGLTDTSLDSTAGIGIHNADVAPAVPLPPTIAGASLLLMSVACWAGMGLRRNRCSATPTA